LSRHLVILNPVAGRGRVRREWPRMLAALRAAGVELEVAETTAPGEGIGLAEHAAREYDAVGEIVSEGVRRLEVEVLPGALRVLS
jgi:diacylglycerol kinase family enzyme